METLGLITLKEADSILEFNLTYDFWNDSTVYETTSGTWTTSGASTNLIGVSTLATTELTVNDIIEIDYNTAIVSVITDNLNITLDTTINVTEDSELVILTSEQRTALIALWLKKKKSLLTAYSLITTYCNLPTTITDELKNAQAFLAAILFYNNGQSTILNGVEKNVKSYSIGDLSYTFSDLQGITGNTPYEIFPSPVYQLLSPYFKNNSIFATVTTSAR